MQRKSLIIYSSLIAFMLIVISIMLFYIMRPTAFSLSSSELYYQHYGWGKWQYQKDLENKQPITQITLQNPSEYSGVAVEFNSLINLSKAYENEKVIIWIKLNKPQKGILFGLSDFVLNKKTNTYTMSSSMINLKNYPNLEQLDWQKAEIPLRDFPPSGEFWAAGITKTYPMDWAHIFAYRFQISGPENSFSIKSIEITNKKLVSTYQFSDLLPNFQKLKNTIKINQLGYFPNASKTAYCSNQAKYFSLINFHTKQEVYKNKLILKKAKDSASGDKIFELNFSSYNTPGKYQLKINNQLSAPFLIHKDSLPLKKMFYQVLNFYYAQRCGTETKATDGTGHQLCHENDAYAGDELIDTTGGWHDAGDFSKQIVYGSIAVTQLLDTYAKFPPKNPLSKKLISEICYELDWFLTMQLDSGGVYHRLMTPQFANAYYAKWIKPNKDTQERFLYDISTLSTASFAGSLAYASRLIKTTDTKRAKKYLAAAELAWKFLEANPQPIFDNFTQDKEDQNKRTWAAIELYLATKQPKYQKYFLKNWKAENELPIPSWEKPLSSGLLHYANLYPNQDLSIKIFKSLKKSAENIVAQSKVNGYPNALYDWEYYWGSNSVVLNKNYLLFAAYHQFKNNTYLETAKAQLGYILGQNPMATSYVTGIGTSYTHFPWHQNNGANFPLLKGMLVGGPNQYPSGADILLSQLIKQKTPPAKCYVDKAYLKIGSWASNEPQVNLNSALLYTLGELIK